MEIIQLLHGVVGLLAALGALFGGVAALMHEVARLKKQGGNMNLPLVLKTRNTRVGKIALLLLLVSFTILAGRALTEDLSENALCTKRAWDFYNASKYDEAVRRAEVCIDDFVVQARRDEKKLQDEKVPLPPTGKVSHEDYLKIIERGVLNDVATSYFIKGRSLEYEGQIEQARRTYQQTREFPHGRCYDPKGWFWSPAQAAEDRLERLAE